jgi:hypothetical protein
LNPVSSTEKIPLLGEFSGITLVHPRLLQSGNCFSRKVSFQPKIEIARLPSFVKCCDRPLALATV